MHKGSIGISAVILVLLSLIFLPACSRNRQLPVPPKLPASNPNLRSQFLFTVADYHYRIGDLHGADFLLRQAWRQDPNSPTLMKHLLKVNSERYIRGMIDDTVITGLIDTLLTLTTFDQEMFILAIDVFDKMADPDRQAEFISLYIDHYPGTDAYIRKLIFEYYQSNTVDFELMEKIRSLAKNDTDILLYLAGIYSITEPQRALDVLWQIHGLSRLEKAEDMLIELTVDHTGNPGIVRLFRSYRMPEDRQYLEALIGYATEKKKYDVILELGKDLLALKSSDFLFPLAVAAFNTDRNEVLAKVVKVAETQTMLHDDMTKVFALAAVRALSEADYSKLHKYISRLPSVADLDLAGAFFIHDWLRRHNKSFATLNLDERMDLVGIFDRLPAYVIPQAIRSYLNTLLCIYLLDDLPTGMDDKWQTLYGCARHLWDKGNRNHNLIEIMQQHYARSEDSDALIALLRQAIELYPYEALYLNNLGYTLLINGGDIDEAGELIRKSLYISPDSPHTHDSMAWYLYLKGDAEAALKWMRLPSQKENMQGTIAYHLGMIHHALGNIEQSITYLELTLELDDDQESSRLAREMLRSLLR